MYGNVTADANCFTWNQAGQYVAIAIRQLLDGLTGEGSMIGHMLATAVGVGAIHVCTVKKRDKEIESMEHEGRMQTYAALRQEQKDALSKLTAGMKRDIQALRHGLKQLTPMAEQLIVMKDIDKLERYMDKVQTGINGVVL